jgi:hypothetical protein
MIAAKDRGARMHNCQDLLISIMYLLSRHFEETKCAERLIKSLELLLGFSYTPMLNWLYKLFTFRTTYHEEIYIPCQPLEEAFLRQPRPSTNDCGMGILAIWTHPTEGSSSVKTSSSISNCKNLQRRLDSQRRQPLRLPIIVPHRDKPDSRKQKQGGRSGCPPALWAEISPK